MTLHHPSSRYTWYSLRWPGVGEQYRLEPSSAEGHIHCSSRRWWHLPVTACGVKPSSSCVDFTYPTTSPTQECRDITFNGTLLALCAWPNTPLPRGCGLVELSRKTTNKALPSHPPPPFSSCSAAWTSDLVGSACEEAAPGWTSEDLMDLWGNYRLWVYAIGVRSSHFMTVSSPSVSLNMHAFPWTAHKIRQLASVAHLALESFVTFDQGLVWVWIYACPFPFSQTPIACHLDGLPGRR